MKNLIIILFFSVVHVVFAQSIEINAAGSLSNASVQVNTQNSVGGTLLPRVFIDERNGISNPKSGLMVYDVELGETMVFDGSEWRTFSLDLENSYNNVVYTDPIGRTDDFLGYSVDIDNETAVVGVPKYDYSLNGNEGAIYVFKKNANDVWQRIQVISGDSYQKNAQLGFSLAISGDWLIAGAPYFDNGSVQNEGRAYVYKKNAVTGLFELIQTLIASDASTNDYFGWSVSIDNTWAAVGAYRDKIGFNGNQGSVSVFERINDSWFSRQRLTDSGGRTDDFFGTSVSIHQNKLAVGATGVDDAGRTDIGAVCVFTLNSGIWMNAQKLIPTGNFTDLYLGTSVCLLGNELVSGATGYPSKGGNPNQGAVFSYSWSGNSFLLNRAIYDNFIGDELFIGKSVGLSGSTILASAFNYGTSYEEAKGAGLIFHIGGYNEAELIIDSKNFGRAFDGAAVAIDGKDFLIGGYQYQNGKGKVAFGKLKN